MRPGGWWGSGGQGFLSTEIGGGGGPRDTRVDLSTVRLLGHHDGRWCTESGLPWTVVIGGGPVLLVCRWSVRRCAQCSAQTRVPRVVGGVDDRAVGRSEVWGCGFGSRGVGGHRDLKGVSLRGDTRTTFPLPGAYKSRGRPTPPNYFQLVVGTCGVVQKFL